MKSPRNPWLDATTPVQNQTRYIFRTADHNYVRVQSTIRTLFPIPED
jgi:hypothetical protein